MTRYHSRGIVEHHCRIGELAAKLGVKTHVIRYWEQEFGVRPLRSAKGHRVYTPAMVERLTVIHELCHVLRFTIEGAKKQLGKTPILNERA